MEYRNTNIIACVDSTKDASIYFDNIIPLNLAEIIPWENNDDLETVEILQKILPPVLLNSSNPLGLSQEMLGYLDVYVNIFPTSIGIDVANEEIDKRASNFLPLLKERHDRLFSVLKEPVDVIFGGKSKLPTNTIELQDPAFVLTGLKLVDTSEIKWRQILELRKDKESTNKLRRLKTFFYQNYTDKPTAFIQDDLLNRIEVYETTAKQLGLKTRDSAFKIIFNSGSLVANTAATIITALSGSSFTIPLSLGIGSAFMLGNVGLEIKSYKRDLYKFKLENPVTYLIDIKEIDKEDN